MNSGRFVDNPFNSFDHLMKSERSGHKYIKREGSKGNYKYYYQQPTAGKGKVKVNGVEYSIESQVPLEQSPKFAKVSDSIFKLIDDKGHASYLMHMKDSGKWSHYKNLKQQSADVEGVDADGEAKPEKPVDTSEIAGTPRNEEKKEFNKEIYREEYVNDRTSAVPQIGEDVKRSARHKAYEWKSLSQAEIDGEASELINRKMLSKLEGHNLIDAVKESNVEDIVAYATVMNKFPPEPKYPKSYVGLKPDDVAIVKIKSQFGRDQDYVVRGQEAADKLAARQVGSSIVSTTTLGELQKKSREFYYESYKIVKNEIEKSIATGEPFSSVIPRVSTIVRLKINSAASYNYDLYKQFNSYLKSVMTVHTYYSNSAASDLVKFKKGTAGMDVGARVEVARKIAEGMGVDKALGKTKAKTQGKRFNPADLYAEKVERSGPELKEKSRDEIASKLTESMGMRAVQWGKSVTDREREYHLQKVAEAFADLADATGLPEGMMSFNGRLGVAIGARGTGKALAHYEPDLQVINLTREGGVGSLAHEWGHFFDNILHELHGTRGNFRQEPFLSSGANTNRTFNPDTREFSVSHNSAVAEAMHEFNDSEAMSEFRQQVDNEVKEVGAKGEYWRSEHEMFARCFEVYVDLKLRNSGRKNTYLSGISGALQTHKEGSKLWPSSEQIKKMEPHFDRIFSEFKKSPYLKKSMEVFKNDDLKKSIHELIEEIQKAVEK